MASFERILVAAIVMGTVADPARAQEIGSAPAIRVVIQNDAALWAGPLDAAREGAERVYRDAGVRLVWSDSSSQEAKMPTIYVRLLSFDAAARFAADMKVGANVLGATNAESRRVYIFCDRIREVASSHGASSDDALGVVMAHEIGHVLLPNRPHSARGIMQASTSMLAGYGRRFDSLEAASVRSVVAAMAAP